MSVKQSDYENLLAEYSSREGAIALLKQYRPYLEIIPSIRRPEQSLITIPLPVARIAQPQANSTSLSGFPSPKVATHLPCELAILMCDPKWKIKLGAEILVFIHRPEEDFSQLLSRWRQIQVELDRDYEWLMPSTEQHLFSEAAEQIYPLFVLFELTCDRIKQGLAGANLPFIIATNQTIRDEQITEIFSTQD